ncbi:MAG: efflux RND transporter periplasmic adaptor subunit [Calditrichaeota bacterium]|nr:MAG: efflux RND transporter periplasmic adaptor subunit [Calditrichota bacterium]
MIKRIIILALSGLIFYGCQSHEHENAEAENEVPAIAVTQWTESMELFMEYETAVVAAEIKFIIHLTTLADFQPVRAGKVTLFFEKADGSAIKFDKDELLREGIFTPTYTFETSGKYNFSLSYTGPKAKEEFLIGTFAVYSSAADIPAGVEEPATDEISFLKEQQWKMEFATEEARVRNVKSTVNGIGKVRPRPASFAQIVSPVEGIISIAAAGQLVNPGQKVKKGETLAVLVPPLAAGNSWAEIYLKYEQAKTEFQRAKRLQVRKAISAREFEQAKRNFDVRKAGFSNYFDSKNSSMRYDSQTQNFLITAPINGIVSDVTVLPGQNIDRNQNLFSIVDPSKVWLSIEVFAEQAAKLAQISGASVSVPGSEKMILFEQSHLKLINRGEILDPEKQTLTILMEADNAGRQLLIGQTFQAQIYTTPATNVLTVPSSAVYDDNGQKTVYIQLGGESFEKRAVKTGPIYQGFIPVTGGVQSGERVVKTGGYQVKLASSSEEIGHPHAH